MPEDKMDNWLDVVVSEEAKTDPDWREKSKSGSAAIDIATVEPEPQPLLVNG